MHNQNAAGRVCIVLPTYNEAANIGTLIPDIFRQEEKISPHELFVLVVDDHSPDGTAKVTTDLMSRFSNLRLISGDKNGLGDAYKRGFAYATAELKADLIFEMDADLQHDPNMIPLFVYLTRFDFDVIIGSRFAPGGSTPNFSLKRKTISLFGNWLIRFFGGLPRIRDCTSGFRCIRRTSLERCDLSFLSTRGYSFQSSLLCELIRTGSRVIEIPIEFPDRMQGESKLSFRDQIEFILNIPKIRYRNSGPFIRFCLSGITGILVNIGFYLFLTRLFGIAMEIAPLIALEISILWNFLLRRFPFTDSSTADLLPAFFRFNLISSIGAIITYGFFLLLAKGTGIHDVVAYLWGIGFGLPFNYAAHSWWMQKEISDNG